MVDLSTVSIIIASIGVLAGVLYNIISIRNENKLRRRESIIRLSPWFNMNAGEIQEAITQVCSIKFRDYDDYVEKYRGRSEQTQLKILGNYFEGLGILVHRRLVEVDLIYEFWGSIIQSTWRDMLPIVKGMREDAGDDTVFAYWELLNNELEKYTKNPDLSRHK
jgi:hypothetical protein